MNNNFDKFKPKPLSKEVKKLRSALRRELQEKIAPLIQHEHTINVQAHELEDGVSFHASIELINHPQQTKTFLYNKTLIELNALIVQHFDSIAFPFVSKIKMRPTTLNAAINEEDMLCDGKLTIIPGIKATGAYPDVIYQLRNEAADLIVFISSTIT